MAYDLDLEQRLDKSIARRKDFHKQKMFGGVGYLLRGNMCFGIWKDGIILRMGEENAAEALKKKHVKVFDITGRVMKGWVMVGPKAFESDASLKAWITTAVEFVSQLPRK